MWRIFWWFILQQHLFLLWSSGDICKQEGTGHVKGKWIAACFDEEFTALVWEWKKPMSDEKLSSPGQFPSSPPSPQPDTFACRHWKLLINVDGLNINKKCRGCFARWSISLEFSQKPLVGLMLCPLTHCFLPELYWIPNAHTGFPSFFTVHLLLIHSFNNSYTQNSFICMFHSVNLSLLF